MPYAKANGIDIWYEVHGEGLPGTPLVMTHGFAGPSRQWIPELMPLAAETPANHLRRPRPRPDDGAT